MFIILALYLCKADTPKRIPFDIPVVISTFKKDLYLVSDNHKIEFKDASNISKKESKVMIMNRDGIYQIKINNVLMCHSDHTKSVRSCQINTEKSSYWEIEPYDQNFYFISAYNDDDNDEKLCLTYENDILLSKCEFNNFGQYMKIMKYSLMLVSSDKSLTLQENNDIVVTDNNKKKKSREKTKV